MQTTFFQMFYFTTVTVSNTWYIFRGSYAYKLTLEVPGGKQLFLWTHYTYIAEFNASVNPLALAFNLCATTE